ncbi:Hsp20/alpha crystallin family protein [Chondrinema litorale]|uniref:Hsp20/alpha crystallin family protein n=1 Tax=Chondrinema litorale TaxID=2994555 RepID=UPI00254307C2|nr:Hsp20/alpha crystallin family protein [Chondrinema litorale]UZR95177.1 Hsp20/alpha crystallin family protein [Chondrinema litorale]
MSLIKYRNGLDSQFPVFTDIFDQLFDKSLFDQSSLNKSTVPAVNVSETENAYRLELAVPGRKKEDFKVEVDNNVLTISSESKEEKTEDKKEGKFTRREFTYHSFSRAFTLPENVNADSIEAAYNDGVLKLDIEKVPVVKPKSIEIK